MVINHLQNGMILQVGSRVVSAHKNPAATELQEGKNFTIEIFSVPLAAIE